MTVNKKYYIAGGISIILTIIGVLVGANVFPNTQYKTDTEFVLDDYKIELSVKPVDTILETEDGNIQVEQYPTVEAIDGGNISCEDESE